MTPAEVDEIARGKRKVYRRGRVLPTRLTEPERAEFERAKQRGYVIARARRRTNLVNVWWRWCEATEQPYTILRPGRRYGDLDMDFLCTTRRFEEAAMRELFERTQRAFPGWRGAIGIRSYATRLPLAEADALARFWLTAVAELVPPPASPPAGAR